MKFEDVFWGVVSSTARVNTCSSKNFNHVGDAEVYGEVGLNVGGGM